MQGYFKLINAQGGVHGRKIELIIEDDQYQPTRTKLAVRKLVEQDGVFALAGGFGTAPNQAVFDYVMEQGVPFVAPASGSSQWSEPPNRYYFGYSLNYTTEGRLLTQFAAEDLGLKQLCLFYQNDDFGHELRNAARLQLGKLGLSPVAEVSHEAGDTQFAPHAQRCQAAGAEAVLLLTVVKPAAGIVRAASELGYSPTWVSSLTNSDPMMFELTDGLWEGAYVIAYHPSPENVDNPRVAEFREQLAEVLPDEPPGGFALHGWAIGQLVVEGLLRAGPDVTRDSFIAALETLDRWDGGLPVSLTYRADERRGNTQGYFSRAEGGRLVPVTGYLTPQD
jgi:branched-chain amino acid transport system substrate-binding protein